MLEVTVHRPMNNEYVQIHSAITRGLSSIEGWHLQQIFINVANKKPRGQPSNIL